MIYHGVDIIEIDRIRKAVGRWGKRFLQRVYTIGELRDCNAFGSAPSYQSLAARWAAKEAVSKALGVGLSGIAAVSVPNRRPRMTDIEVVRDTDGRPRYGCTAPPTLPPPPSASPKWPLVCPTAEELR